MYPDVTVLITVYNGERYLKEAIDSILNQTFSGFEIVVVNDGSTDSTGKILSSYDDKRLRIINNEKNIGPARSSNIGLKIAKGRYIARMDADDISLPERLEKQVKLLNNNNKIKLVGSAWYVIDEDGAEISIVIPPHQEHHAVHFMCHGTIMAKKECIEAIGLYNEIFRYALDYDFLLRFQESYNISIIDEPLYKLRIHSQSISQVKKPEQELYAVLALKMAEMRKNSPGSISVRPDPDKSANMLNEILNASWLEKHKILSQMYLVWGKASMASERNKSALKYALKAVKLNILNRSVYVLLADLVAEIFKNRSTALLYNNIPWIRQAFWNSRASSIDENWGHSKDDYDVLKNIITAIKPFRILDIGCGTGRLFPLFDYFHVNEVVGQDFSAKALEIANTRYKFKNIKTVNISILDLELPFQYFDLSISNRVLQHVPKSKIEKYIKKLTQLSKYIYINEMCKSDNIKDTYYMFQHNYEKLFEKNDFFLIKKGMIGRQTWHLFSCENIKGLS